MIPRPMGEQLRASEPREMLHFDFLQMAFSEEEEAGTKRRVLHVCALIPL